MDFLRADQRAKITSILCHQNEILLDASSQNRVIRRAKPPEVAWVYCDVGAIGMQGLSNPRRQTLIKEQLHRFTSTMIQATFFHGRPDGRPRSG